MALGGLLALQPSSADAILDRAITSINLHNLVGIQSEPVFRVVPHGEGPNVFLQFSWDDDEGECARESAREGSVSFGCSEIEGWLAGTDAEAPEAVVGWCRGLFVGDAAGLEVPRVSVSESSGRRRVTCEGSEGSSGTGIYEITIMHFLLVFLAAMLVMASGALQLFLDWLARGIPGLQPAEVSELDKAVEKERDRRRKANLSTEARARVDFDEWFHRPSDRRARPGNSYAAVVPHGADGAAEKSGDDDPQYEAMEKGGEETAKVEMDHLKDVILDPDLEHLEKRVGYYEEAVSSESKEDIELDRVRDGVDSDAKERAEEEEELDRVRRRVDRDGGSVSSG